MDLQPLFPGRPFSANPHITLFFIPRAQDIEKYAAALRGVKAGAFELSLTALGTFANRVLWAGADGGAPLERLQSEIAKKMEALGEPAENRRFTPHITLARLKAPLSPREKAAVRNIKLDCRWLADEFCLYESILHPGQAEHIVVENYRLIQTAPASSLRN